MKLADVSVSRPVFAIMMTAALIVLGWSSYGELGLDLMPKTDSPTVNVRASLPGASAEEIETHDHQARSRRRSTPSAASTSCAAAPTRATATAPSPSRSSATSKRRRRTSATRSRPSRSSRATPSRRSSARSIPTPPPILTLVVFSDRARRRRSPRSPTSRSSRCSRRSRTSARSRFIGDRQARDPAPARTPNRLNAYGLTVDQVAQRGRRARTSRFPAAASSPARPSSRCARWAGSRRRRLQDRSSSPTQDGSVITFGDVGRVTDANEEVRSQTRLDGENADLDVDPQAVGHQHRRGRRSRAWRRLERIQATLPPDIKISVGSDQSRFIRRVVRGHPAAPDPRRPPRRARRVPVHPQPARHVHRRARDPDLDHRHVHVHEERSASR